MPPATVPHSTRMHQTDHTSRSSTWGIFRLRAKLVVNRGCTGGPADHGIAVVGEHSRRRGLLSPAAAPAHLGPARQTHGSPSRWSGDSSAHQHTFASGRFGPTIVLTSSNSVAGRTSIPMPTTLPEAADAQETCRLRVQASTGDRDALPLSCGDVMPGCAATFEADSEDDLLAQVGPHAAEPMASRRSRRRCRGGQGPSSSPRLRTRFPRKPRRRLGAGSGHPRSGICDCGRPDERDETVRTQMFGNGREGALTARIFSR